MGKPHRPFGLPKPRKEGRKKHRAAIGMLLDAVWDGPTAMFIKTVMQPVEPGMIPPYKNIYFNHKGEELPLKEAKHRMRLAEHKRLKGRHNRKNYKSSLIGDSISYGQSHMNDAMQYAMASRSHGKSVLNNRLPLGVTEDENEKSGVRPVGSDTIYIARRPDVRTRK